ncbi:hypothetical protein AB0E62_27820 [Streptomyces sp. NPDC038707]|uniref:hypothetical protein n=1 Tax=Streptomyces sp. NPDC038707 TaxID=3154329 RepID=UPI0034096099
MTTWGLIVETTRGSGDHKHLEAQVVVHFTGSRAQALAELERRARSYSPEHPRFPKRRRLLRDGDGFLLVVDGAMQSFLTRFTVAELLEDSGTPVTDEDVIGAPDAPEPAAGKTGRHIGTPAAPGTSPAGPVAGGDVERYADGVPVRPAWLGRTDLP